MYNVICFNKLAYHLQYAFIIIMLGIEANSSRYITRS